MVDEVAPTEGVLIQSASSRILRNEASIDRVIPTCSRIIQLSGISFPVVCFPPQTNCIASCATHRCESTQPAIGKILLHGGTTELAAYVAPSILHEKVYGADTTACNAGQRIVDPHSMHIFV